MADFLERACAACKGLRVSRVAYVRFHGRIVETVQCWQCGHTTVTHYLSHKDAEAELVRRELKAIAAQYPIQFLRP